MAGHGRGSSRFDPHETAWADALAGAELAPFGRRAGAFLIDLGFALVTAVPLFVFRYEMRPRAARGDLVIAFDFHDLWSLGWIVLYFGGTTWLGHGRTPGKWLMGLRVASVIGARVTLWQAIERSLGYGASALEGGFGFVQFFIARNRQCVHDRIAETIVLRVRTDGGRGGGADTRN